MLHPLGLETAPPEFLDTEFETAKGIRIAMDQDVIVKAAEAATTEVFTTMLNLQAVPEASHLEQGSPEVVDGIVALIGLAGPWIGTGVINCSPGLACRISSTMLMSEYEAVNADVLDAVAEIANMIVGNVKTTLEEHVGPLGLSVPTVVYGRNFFVKSVGPQSWTVVPFRIGSELLTVKLCLAQNQDPQGTRTKRTYSLQC